MNLGEAEIVKSVIETYANAFGQQINLGKYVVCFYRNVSVPLRNAICDALRIVEKEDLGCYLDLPTHIGKTRRKFFVSLKIAFGRG